MYERKQMRNGDIPRVEAFLNARKDTTLFALGNIEKYGLENDYCCIAWLNDGEIVACVFNFMEKYLTAVLSEQLDPKLYDEIREFIRVTPHEDFAVFNMYFDALNIKSDYSNIRYNNIAKTDSHFQLNIQELDGVTFQVLESEGEDLDTLAQLITQVEGFDRDDVEENKAVYKRTLPPMGYTLYAKLNGEIVGSATLTGISKTTAVVTSVWVLPHARMRGIAGQLIHRLQDAFSSEARVLYIMYSNPAAARIYLNNGFSEIGKGYIAEK